MFLLTTQLAHHSKNVRQQKQDVPQQFTHNVIIHLHWCFGHQGDMLSKNPTLLDAPAIWLGGIKIRLSIKINKWLVKIV